MKYAVCGVCGWVPSCVVQAALLALAVGCDDLALPSDPFPEPDAASAPAPSVEPTMRRDRAGLPLDAPLPQPPATDTSSERPVGNATRNPSGNVLNERTPPAMTESEPGEAESETAEGEDVTDGGAPSDAPSRPSDDDNGGSDEAAPGESVGSSPEPIDDRVADAGVPLLLPEGPCPSSARLAQTSPFSSLPALLLVDEFDEPDTLSCQRERAGLFVPGWENGQLLIEPDREQVPNGWHDNGIGPFVGWAVSGDFVIEAPVRATRHSDPTSPPSAPYAGAGLVLFDPNPPLGRQASLAYVIGFQRHGLGRTIKDTRDAETTRVTNETLGESNLRSSTAQIRVCRVGQHYSFFHRANEAEGWRVEGVDVETIGQGSETRSTLQRVADLPEPTKPFSPYRPQRADLPDLIHVGLTAEHLGESGDVQGLFDRVVIARIANESQCTAKL